MWSRAGIQAGKLISVRSQTRNLSTIHKLNIAKPTISPNANDILNQYPRHEDNSINVSIPGNIANPYAAAAGGDNDKDFVDPTMRKFAGLNIATPLSGATGGAQKTTTGGGNIGVVGRFGEDTPNLEQNLVTCTGFGGNLLSVNQIAFYSSLVVLPGMVFSWKPKTWDEVDAASLALLAFVYPQPDLILFGCGLLPRAPSISAHHMLKTLNIPYEVLPTNAALGTFNLLNEEYRRVAAFIIALDDDTYHDYELMQANRFSHNS